MGLFYAESSNLSKKFKQKDVAATVAVELQPIKQHEFVRKHFNRTTQCDFCGKKVGI